MTTTWNNATVRQLENESIRAFVESCADHLTGRVLDLGCGDQRYRRIVEASGGEYVGYDDKHLPGNPTGETYGPFDPFELRWDAVLCTQVLQYVPDVPRLLGRIRASLRPQGVLLLTYATCWDEVEPEDLHRHTFAGINTLLVHAGFEVEWHERRAEVDLGGFRFPLGGAVVARP